MSKQKNLEKRQIVRMLICLALLTAGGLLFLPRHGIMVENGRIFLTRGGL